MAHDTINRHSHRSRAIARALARGPVSSLFLRAGYYEMKSASRLLHASSCIRVFYRTRQTPEPRTLFLQIFSFPMHAAENRKGARTRFWSRPPDAVHGLSYMSQVLMMMILVVLCCFCPHPCFSFFSTLSLYSSAISRSPGCVCHAPFLFLYKARSMHRPYSQRNCINKLQFLDQRPFGGLQPRVALTSSLLYIDSFSSSRLNDSNRQTARD